MSRVQIPVAGKVLWHTGDLRLWVEMQVKLRDGSGNWRQRTFRIDSATDISTMGAYEAKKLGLPMPVHPTVGAKHKQSGLEIRSGYLRFQIVGMDLAEYVSPCFFLGDPTALPTGSPAILPRKLLQPLALLGQLRFAMNHDPGDGTPYGVLVVEKK
jgi:hypothetical protein